MKNYIITVNGVEYEVSVEEVGESGASAAPVRAAAPAPKKTATKKAAPAGAGSVKISAPMPGKILAVKANVGASLKQGDVILVLEAMKMENEIVAPSDGVLASVDVAVGDQVEAGVTLASMN